MEPVDQERVFILAGFRCGIIPTQNAIGLRVQLDGAESNQSLDLLLSAESAEALESGLREALERLRQIQ